MALSNMRREPRREITEQVIGTVAVLGGAVIFFTADYSFVKWLLASDMMDIHGTADVIFAVILLPIMVSLALLAITFIGYGFVYVCHEAGEALCAKLGRFDPRPKQRY